MTSVAVVLGGGGVLGCAFHTGALAALAGAGWDARTADLLVGTSAGSGVAATLRAGFSPAAHLAATLGDDLPPGEPEGVSLVPREAVDPLPGPGAPIPLNLLPQSPGLLAAALFGPGRYHPGLLAGLLPRGTADTTPLGDRVRAAYPAGVRWPEAPLWIAAVRLGDGKRTVFGRDDVDLDDPGLAVQASSAIPMRSAPVRIGDHEYIDGGAHAVDNADLVAHLGFDVVIVVSPITNGPDVPTGPVPGIRALATRGLERDLAKVRRLGAQVLTIQPGPADLRAMGRNLTDRTHARRVAVQAHESVSRRLAEPDATAVLDRLSRT